MPIITHPRKAAFVGRVTADLRPLRAVSHEQEHGMVFTGTGYPAASALTIGRGCSSPNGDAMRRAHKRAPTGLLQMHMKQLRGPKLGSKDVIGLQRCTLSEPQWSMVFTSICAGQNQWHHGPRAVQNRRRTRIDHGRRAFGGSPALYPEPQLWKHTQDNKYRP